MNNKRTTNAYRFTVRVDGFRSKREQAQVAALYTLNREINEFAECSNSDYRSYVYMHCRNNNKIKSDASKRAYRATGYRHVTRQFATHNDYYLGIRRVSF